MKRILLPGQTEADADDRYFLSQQNDRGRILIDLYTTLVPPMEAALQRAQDAFWIMLVDVHSDPPVHDRRPGLEGKLITWRIFVLTEDGQKRLQDLGGKIITHERPPNQVLS
jgi:hypothetical protein